MKNKLMKIGIIILGLLILLSTTVLGRTDISSLLEPDEIENVEPITSVSTQITRILGTMASIIIPIILSGVGSPMPSNNISPIKVKTISIA